jgi:hypothetical protein
MPEEIWAQGFACDHSILAGGSTPSGAITNWLNEGYRPSAEKFDTVGHRRSILDAGYKNISYGYSGGIAIGKRGSKGNAFPNAFAAFPAAGYMPSNLLSVSESAWTVELNTNIIQVQDKSQVNITVKNLTT